MVHARSTKIWVLLSHAFIVIGLGHGVMTIGLLEIFTLLSIFDSFGSSGGDVSSWTLRSVAMSSFIGQISILASMCIRHKYVRISLHLIGLLLLIFSLLVFSLGIRSDSYSHIAILSVVPFFFFAIWTVFGKYIRKTWLRILG